MRYFVALSFFLFIILLNIGLNSSTCDLIRSSFTCAKQVRSVILWKREHLTTLTDRYWNKGVPDESFSPSLSFFFFRITKIVRCKANKASLITLSLPWLSTEGHGIGLVRCEMLQVTLISFLYHMSVAACTVRVFPLDKIHIKLRKPDFQPFIFFPSNNQRHRI